MWPLSQCFAILSLCLSVISGKDRFVMESGKVKSKTSRSVEKVESDVKTITIKNITES